MKNIVLFIALIMLTKPFWPVIEYVTQYDYIVSTLCENKDKPEMECDGKCYLSKQLAKEAGNDENNPFNQTSKTEIPQFIISEAIPDFKFVSETEIKNVQNFGFETVLYLSPDTLNILHPPELG